MRSKVNGLNESVIYLGFNKSLLYLGYETYLSISGMLWGISSNLAGVGPDWAGLHNWPTYLTERSKCRMIKINCSFCEKGINLASPTLPPRPESPTPNILQHALRLPPLDHHPPELWVPASVCTESSFSSWSTCQGGINFCILFFQVFIILQFFLLFYSI